VVEGLREPVSAAGLLVAAQSIGSALALIIFVPLRRRGWSRRMAAMGLALQAAGLIGAWLAPVLPVAVVAVVLVGFGFSLCFPVLTSALQLEVPDAVRGRIMAVHQTAHLGNRPIMAVTVGALATAFGAQPAVAAGAVLAPIGILATRRAWRLLSSRAPGPGADPAAVIAASTAEGAGS
jgi:MFS family permease